MSETPGDAQINSVPADQIASLAILYDRFAHALDPFSKLSDTSEKQFEQEVAYWYDTIPNPKPTLSEFRKAVIVRCKRHLTAQDKKHPTP